MGRLVELIEPASRLPGGEFNFFSIYKSESYFCWQHELHCHACQAEDFLQFVYMYVEHPASIEQLRTTGMRTYVRTFYIT